MDHAPAPLLATTLSATLMALSDDTASLLVDATQETVHFPTKLLPLGLGVGAKVYLRALSAAALDAEADEVARRVLEQFLN